MGSTVTVDLRSEGVKATQAPPTAPRPWPSSAKFKTGPEKNQAFDVQTLLDSAGVRRKVVEYGSKEIVFTQGDPVNKVMYIQKGGVKLTVVNAAGKEAVVAILGPGDFVGEGCLAGQSTSIETATMITTTTLFIIEKDEMIRVLDERREFSDRFIAYLLARNMRAEEDLMDQLFNSSEKRLARALLLLARFGEQNRFQKRLPEVSQEMLAEMIGTTRSRVNCFMNKFRKLGFIEYGGRLRGLQINESLLRVVECERSEQDAPVRFECSSVPAMAPERNRVTQETRRCGRVCRADPGNN
jgi:CRP/FNR family transcriptional regulator, cyclic AMP receptor protein